MTCWKMPIPSLVEFFFNYQRLGRLGNSIRSSSVSLCTFSNRSATLSSLARCHKFGYTVGSWRRSKYVLKGSVGTAHFKLSLVGMKHMFIFGLIERPRKCVHLARLRGTLSSANALYISQRKNGTDSCRNCKPQRNQFKKGSYHLAGLKAWTWHDMHNLLEFNSNRIWMQVQSQAYL
jgi:hypothetical protein